MRFESLTAQAFGPFQNRPFAFAPGFIVVHGPNESGKSSLHAALYAGLCGLRRTRGARAAPDRDFENRHRPWDCEGWRVSVRLRLEDGRAVELVQDLDGRTGSSATDAAMGRDYTGEILHEGAPDASKWLGLDRRSFLATACVRQAHLLEVLESPEVLQEHLQRAVDTAGTDATAARALERVDAYQRENVGQDRLPWILRTYAISRASRYFEGKTGRRAHGSFH